MSLLDDLVSMIVTAGIATELDTDIFENFMPDLPESVVDLEEFDSVVSPIRGANASVRYIQVKVRDRSSSVAQTKAKQIFDLLMHSDSDDEDIMYLTSGRWVIINPQQLPFKIAITEHDLYVWGFNAAITTSND